MNIGCDLGPQQVLDAIEALVADEFCADAECRLAFHPDRIGKTEQVAIEKLLRIYTIVHAYNPKNSCYKAHDGWRREAVDMLCAIGRDLKGDSE